MLLGVLLCREAGKCLRSATYIYSMCWAVRKTSHFLKKSCDSPSSCELLRGTCPNINTTAQYCQKRSATFMATPFVKDWVTCQTHVFVVNSQQCQNKKRNDSNTFHLPGLFILCCQPNVKVLLVAANHGINRAFPALWWSKRSFGEGARRVPCTEQTMVPGEGGEGIRAAQSQCAERKQVSPEYHRGSLS